MKRLHFIMLLCFVAISLYGQSPTPDNQWYILNNEYWESSQYVGPEYSNDVTVNGVQPPDSACDPNADDDLFVIFSDNSFALTRGGCNINISSSAMDIHTADSIKYLYWTNIYDVEEPPESIVVIDNTGGTASINLTPYSNSFSIIANHTVKPGSDITLVIDNLELSPGAVSKLVINQVHYQNPNGGAMVEEYIPNAFSQSPIFFDGTSSDFVLGSTYNYDVDRDGIQTIELTPNGNARFTFINLRATSELTDFEGSAFVNFKLNGITEHELQESINSIHDPNKIALEGICDKDDCTKIVYSGYFYNRDTITAAEDLAIAFDLPSHLEGTSIKFNSITYNNDPISTDVRLDIIDGRITCYFDSTLQIRVCPGSIIKENGYVRFNFCADVKKESVNTIRDPNVVLDLKDPKTIFNLGSTRQYFNMEYVGGVNVNGESQVSSSNCDQCDDECYAKKRSCIFCWQFWDDYWLSIIVAAIIASLLMIYAVSGGRITRNNNDDDD